MLQKIYRLGAFSVVALVGQAIGLADAAMAQEADADLAKKLSNPVASLISVPFQFNYDRGFGPNRGDRKTLDIQPVIPFALNEDWNLISRTIVPVTWQHDIAGSSGNQFGLGDISQSFFISPTQPTSGGIIWGAGPVFLLPTATDDLLGGGKFGLGPTAVVLKQEGPWTVGALGNHIWSVAGKGDKPDINATYLQPFISYRTSDAWTFTLNTESTYDWKADQWAVPINFQVAKLVKFGEQPVSLSAGARYWAAAPENGPHGWGARVGLSLLFPN
ncbi:transporter [Agrobacterium tumefaciens]|uniref:transporter n=1 Tax=Agrobacterium tumefaciens TaxID=358 RepID=UPI001573EFA0